MSDLGQRRRTVRVLGLLNDSFEAHVLGDMAAADRLIDEAAGVDGTAVAAIVVGIMIGEIPDPDRDWTGWATYVQAARDALADAETTGTGIT